MSNSDALVRAAVGCAWICAWAIQLSACSAQGCEGVGRTYPVGARWTCADGCNYCQCEASDTGSTVVSSLIACPEPPGPAANKLLCTQDGVHMHGDTWTCGEVVTCTCVDGEIERKQS